LKNSKLWSTLDLVGPDAQVNSPDRPTEMGDDELVSGVEA
jgi:hypothetical protein